jgi:putative GTP pyrophosphokinase
MLDKIIDDWEKKQSDYKLLCETIEKNLYDLIQNEGIQVKIDYRSKDTISLARKLIKIKLDKKTSDKRKKIDLFNEYEKLTDKAGIRIICRFIDEIESIAKIIRSNFEVLKEDNKIDHLNYNEMGYKSYHFDVKLKKDLTDHSLFKKIGTFQAEIQVRTLCENVWAEIDHDIGYKSTSEVPKIIKRQIHCLGGLFEVADDSLATVNRSLTKSAKINEEFLLRVLEPYFIRYFKKEYDRDFSLRTLKKLKTISRNFTAKKIQKLIATYIEKNDEKIKFILEQNHLAIKQNPYFSQPEIFLIFYLLEKNKHQLVKSWESNFFIEDLERIGELWGESISSIIDERQ